MAHQSDYCPVASLMHSHAIKEPLHDHAPCWAVSHFRTGAMEIENHLRFAEPAREQVPRFGTVDATTGISDQSTLGIVDRKYDSAPQKTRTSIIADPEPGRRGLVNSTMVQVRMPSQT